MAGPGRGVRRGALVTGLGSFRLERYLELPVGGDDGLPDEVVQTPTTSLRTDKPPGLMRAPVRLRAAPDGELLVLAPDPAWRAGPGEAVVLGFSRDGVEARRTAIAPPGAAPGWRLVDYAAAAEGSLYLLEQSLGGESHTELKRLSAGDEIVWNVDLDRIDGGFDRLLVDRRGTAYVSAASRHGLVARIDPADGRLEPYADWGDYRGDALMDGDGVVYYVQFLPQTGVRYWVRLDPAAGEVSQVPAAVELTDFLARPLGVDDRGRAYGTSGMRVACMAADGSPAWLFDWDGLVPAPDGELWTSTLRDRAGSAVVEVRRWADGSEQGEPLALELPAGVDGAAWRLVGVEEGRLVVFGGETPGVSGTVLTFSPDGEVLEVADPAPPDVRLTGSWLQPPATWSVALDGSVYLPVSGPGRLDVVRLSAT